MTKIQLLIVIALMLAVRATAASAATFTIIPTISQFFDLQGNAISTAEAYRGNPVVFQVDLTFTIGNLTANEGGFSATAFDIGLSPGLTPADPIIFGGYQGDTTTYSFGSKHFPVYQENSDFGPSVLI